MPSDRRIKLERYFGLDLTTIVLALDLARACGEEGDLLRAREVLDAARQNLDQNPAHLNELGLMLGSLGQWSHAIEVLQEAVAIDEVSPVLRFNLGYAQLSNASNKYSPEVLPEIH